MIDELSQAVLSREEVVRYLKGAHGESPEAAQERVYAYLEELRTTQRYRLYRALQAPGLPDSPEDPAARRARRPRDCRHRGRAGHLRVGPQEPHRLPDRAAGARRPRRAAADHRRRHQPVRRPARPPAQARHRRGADPARHEGPGVPDHAEGVRGRAAARPRPALLHRGRAELQRRSEGAEDGPDPRRHAVGHREPGHPADGDLVRPGPRRPHPVAPGREEAAAAVRQRTGRDDARARSATGRGRS